jgi:hypothetical protein
MASIRRPGFMHETPSDQLYISRLKAEHLQARNPDRKVRPFAGLAACREGWRNQKQTCRTIGTRCVILRGGMDCSAELDLTFMGNWASSSPSR